MNMRLPMGLSRRGGSTPSLSAQVEAILAGKAGFFLDPHDLSTMWLENTKITQATAGGQTIGALRNNAGTVPFDMLQASATQRPALSASMASLTTDGIDDRVLAGTQPLTNNVEKATFAIRVKRISGTSDRAFIGICAGNSSNNERFFLRGTGTSVKATVRRADAAAVGSFPSAASVIVLGSEHTIYAEVDYAGAGAIRVWVDGVQRVNAALGGNSDERPVTDTLQIRLPDQGMDALLGRAFYSPEHLSAGDRTIVENALAEFPL